MLEHVTFLSQLMAIHRIPHSTFFLEGKLKKSIGEGKCLLSVGQILVRYHPRTSLHTVLYSVQLCLPTNMLYIIYIEHIQKRLQRSAFFNCLHCICWVRYILKFTLSVVCTRKCTQVHSEHKCTQVHSCLQGGWVGGEGTLPMSAYK